MFLPLHSNKLISMNNKFLIIASLILSPLFSSNSYAMQYNFIVQPIHTPEKIKEIYQPLVDYLNTETGHTFNVVTSTSFISYWEKMRKGKFDLILDAAHFTDYRIKRMNYTVLAKLPHTESFSIITKENEHISDYKKLIGKKLITLPSPSLSAVHLAKMFPNPARQPNITNTNSAEAAINAVLKGKYFAALVPTSMLSKINNINTVNTTMATPRMAISASPKIAKDIQKKIQLALIKASTTTRGQSMLASIKALEFKEANAATYKGYEKLLAGVWGY